MGHSGTIPNEEGKEDDLLSTLAGDKLRSHEREMDAPTDQSIQGPTQHPQLADNGPEICTPPLAAPEVDYEALWRLVELEIVAWKQSVTEDGQSECAGKTDLDKASRRNVQKDEYPYLAPLRWRSPVHKCNAICRCHEASRTTSFTSMVEDLYVALHPQIRQRHNISGDGMISVKSTESSLSIDRIPTNLAPTGKREMEQHETSPEISMLSTHECVVCGESKESTTFPVLNLCGHLPQTCATCYRTWIAYELASKRWDQIKCPGEGCSKILSHYDVQQYASREVYNRFEDLSARSALDNDPDFCYCRAPGCRSGQIHVRRKDGNIFQCVDCGFRVCLTHQNTSHEGETCARYDARIKKQRSDPRQSRKVIMQEEASIKAVMAVSKKCPNSKCPYRIQKSEGCDHMTCTKCRHEFCWNCLMPWSRVHSTICRTGRTLGG